MVRKIKGKKKKAKPKPKAPARGVKVVTNIHIASKSGTRSARQRKGGVGGSVAPSGASTISHVPLVMNVPTPDATQRETKWLHTLEDIQGDNIALRMQLEEFTKRMGDNPDKQNTNPFQSQPSESNYAEEDYETALPEAPARPAGPGRPRKDTQRAEKMDTPSIMRSASLPPMPSVSRTAQGTGLGTEEQSPPRGKQGTGLGTSEKASSGGKTTTRKKKQETEQKKEQATIDQFLKMKEQRS
jgi:hypothetical protein